MLQVKSMCLLFYHLLQNLALQDEGIGFCVYSIDTFF